MKKLLSLALFSTLSYGSDITFLNGNYNCVGEVGATREIAALTIDAAKLWVSVNSQAIGGGYEGYATKHTLSADAIELRLFLGEMKPLIAAAKVEGTERGAVMLKGPFRTELRCNKVD